MLFLACSVCRKKYAVYPYRLKKSLFCSRRCYGKSNLGKPTWNKGLNKTVVPQMSHSGVKKGNTPWNKGKTGVQTAWNKGKKTGLVPWNKDRVGIMPTPWNKGKKMPQEVIDKMKRNRKPYVFTAEQKLHMSKLAREKGYGKWMIGKTLSQETRLKQSRASGGENHWNWKGGITPVNTIIRGSLKYREWRDNVFKRDDWTCKMCGKRGGDLEANHIKRFADFKELRFNLKNGVTLCRGCHRRVTGREMEWLPLLELLI